MHQLGLVLNDRHKPVLQAQVVTPLLLPSRTIQPSNLVIPVT